MAAGMGNIIWVVVKIMVPFWVPEILGAVLYLGTKKDHNFDNYRYTNLVGRFGLFYRQGW